MSVAVGIAAAWVGAFGEGGGLGVVGVGLAIGDESVIWEGRSVSTTYGGELERLAVVWCFRALLTGLCGRAMRLRLSMLWKGP